MNKNYKLRYLSIFADDLQEIEEIHASAKVGACFFVVYTSLSFILFVFAESK